MPRQLPAALARLGTSWSLSCTRHLSSSFIDHQQPDINFQLHRKIRPLNSATFLPRSNPALSPTLQLFDRSKLPSPSRHNHIHHGGRHISCEGGANAREHRSPESRGHLQGDHLQASLRHLRCSHQGIRDGIVETRRSVPEREVSSFPFRRWHRVY